MCLRLTTPQSIKPLARLFKSKLPLTQAAFNPTKTMCRTQRVQEISRARDLHANCPPPEAQASVDLGSAAYSHHRPPDRRTGEINQTAGPNSSSHLNYSINLSHDCEGGLELTPTSRVSSSVTSVVSLANYYNKSPTMWPASPSRVDNGPGALASLMACAQVSSASTN